MKVELKRRSRIWHEVGEIVEVSPAEASFLVSVGSAVAVGADKGKAETPDDGHMVETAEAKPKKAKKR